MSAERRITNAEYMINLLMDLLRDEDVDFKRIDIDDGWASGEAMINYNVACPYFSGDERAICNKDDSLIDREHCVECKQKWLLSEVDEFSEFIKLADSILFAKKLRGISCNWWEAMCEAQEKMKEKAND